MSIAPRPSSAAWALTSTLVVPLNIVHQDCPSDDSLSPVHSLIIGSARVVLDIRSGVGYEIHPGRTVPRGLTPAESRLVLLDWTRARIPVPAPNALWAIEAAILAVNSAQHWRNWAMRDLHEALLALLGSQVRWTEGGRTILVDELTKTSSAPAPVDSAALNAIMGELAGLVDSKLAPVLDAVPRPETVSGYTEVEWDRLRGAGVDAGELGLRSRICGTVWTAMIGQPALQRSQNAVRVWARLVDDESGAVLDESEMQKANRLWSARGYVPPSARKAATRVDLALRPDLPARMRTERERVLVDQRWFRMLQFERLGSINSSWSLWCETYRRRLGIQAASWAEQWSKPFLAERHLRPTDLASGNRGPVSYDSPGSVPPAS
jgi:hypothetical protein